ncbi:MULTISPECIES: Hpt domain-containing protein [unclassified Vibrio]|uniref:Hpt domain-containing protein n=1 Tax=Vibrio sp. HB236076 TaxID=3232307 RepID=A0AB39HDT2_9VIBR|nr:Hpt domain-containing protein [Vibrio sp. HB161653]MDP5253735.1 Hpt domain-containing protein [Vibrio sp. HB161653]
MNKQKLEQLQNEIGRENIPMLLNIFLGELEVYNQQLNRLKGEEQLDYMLEITHALKSSAASFGADQLCVIAQEIDTSGKQQTLVDQDKEVARLTDVLLNTATQYHEVALSFS